MGGPGSAPSSPAVPGGWDKNPSASLGIELNKYSTGGGGGQMAFKKLSNKKALSQPETPCLSRVAKEMDLKTGG